MAAPSDAPQVDTAEQIYISSLALLKMLKHGASLKHIHYEVLKMKRSCSGFALQRHEVTKALLCFLLIGKNTAKCGSLPALSCNFVPRNNFREPSRV